jgi:hypothetical protein
MRYTEIILLFTLFFLGINASFSQKIEFNEIKNFNTDFVCNVNQNQNSKTIINIFYDANTSIDCYKSKLIKNAKKCNYEDFLKKFKSEVNISRKDIVVNFYQINNKEIINYLNQDGNYIKLFHITAIIHSTNKEILNKLEILQEKNQFKQITPNRIYNFSDTIQTYEKALKLNSNWYSLQPLKEYLGQTCLTLDIPQEDIFINYLKLLFDPSFQEEPTSIVQKDSTVWGIKKIISDTIIPQLDLLTKKVDLISKKLSKEVKPDSINKFSINLSTAALLSGKIKSSTGPYNNQLGINQQPMRFAIDFQYWMNNFRLGLGYSYSNFQFNNSLADSSYSTTWNSSFLGNSNQLNVYYKNIQEKISFQNNNLYLLAGYSIPFSNNKLRIDIDASFQYSLPFVVNSKLANGEFTYRAQVNGIEDEMMNIPELGLVENDLSSRGKESNFKMHGIGFNIGSNLVYSYKNFDIKFGLGYNYNSYTNEKYNENSRMTELVGDYKSSLLSSKTISAQFFMLQLALGYTIK